MFWACLTNYLLERKLSGIEAPGTKTKKVNFTLEQAMMAQRGNSGIALHFL